MRTCACERGCEGILVPEDVGQRKITSLQKVAPTIEIDLELSEAFLFGFLCEVSFLFLFYMTIVVTSFLLAML